MKKIIISILLILTVSFLSWCSIDWNNGKDKKIIELEKQVSEIKKEKENDLFKKNIECNKLENEIKSFATNFYWEEIQIKNIFYSPKRKSCLFSVFVVRSNFDNKIYILDIMDILSKESIYWIDSKELFLYKDVIDWNCFWMEKKCDNFNNKIKELKWE
jgi:hypothetical protein